MNIFEYLISVIIVLGSLKLVGPSLYKYFDDFVDDTFTIVIIFGAIIVASLIPALNELLALVALVVDLAFCLIKSKVFETIFKFFTTTKEERENEHKSTLK
jgi:hypothetical protein